MPLTAIGGQLSFVASADLGGLGPNEGEPVLVEWKWYQHWPSLYGWALIVLLLILVRENRCLQAWTLLIPYFLLAGVFLPWSERLFGASALMQGIDWFVAALAVLWAIGPWLRRCWPVVGFVAATVIAVVVVMVPEVGISGGFSHELIELFLIALAAVGSSLAAFVLAGRCCRRKFGPWRFLAWLVVWLLAAFSASLVTIALILAGPGVILIAMLFMSIFFTAAVFLLHLPFMILAFNCPVYRKRLCEMLRLPEGGASSRIASDGAEPPALPPAVAAADMPDGSGEPE